MLTSQIAESHYDPLLVTLSVLIAIFASYAALSVIARMRDAQGRSRIPWLLTGAVAMGTGIWAMHYVGMFALKLPVEVKYDWLRVLLSIVVAVVGSGLGFLFVSRPVMNRLSWLVGSVLLGSGIASMHYIGMAAMNDSLECVYNGWLVALSIFLAIVVSAIALKLTHRIQDDDRRSNLHKLRAALVMGMAIPVMHYVGMAAATFVMTSHEAPTDARALSISNLALGGIVVVTLVILGIAILTSWLDRRLYQQAAELERSRKQLQAIFENMTEGIVVIDRSRNILQSNDVAARILNLPQRSATVGEVHRLVETLFPDGTLIPEDRLPSARAFRGDFLTNYKLQIRMRETGKTAVVEVSTRPLTRVEGELQEVMICYRDITQREEMETARSRLAAIVNWSEDAIIGKTEEGIVTSWNRGAEKIFGYTGAEMIGQSIRILLPPGHEHEEDEILAHIKSGGTVEHFETVRRRKNGELMQVSLTISPIRDAAGQIVGVSKICRDITATKMLQKQLQQSQKMEAIGQLTGGIAHDFNNLLGVVIGNLDLLEPLVKENPKAHKRADSALKAATRGAELTRRLLAFSSNQELTPGPTPLSEPVSNVLELGRRVIGPEIKISSQFNAPECRAMVDPAGLENAILNLMVNSRDAMPNGGELAITVDLKELEEEHPLIRSGELRCGTYARISVSDTGTGMDRAVADRAFEPFFTTKERGRGTGLGLAMVYGFARQSGGAARIYSEPGQGTTVSLYLPLAGDLAAEKKRAVPGTPENWLMPLNIMVVDDEEELLEIAAEFLTDMKHRVISARSGVDAIALLQRHPETELVITDVMMPGGMNGVELSRELRKLNPRLKTIFTSGFSADSLSAKDGRVPEGPVLQKPYQRADLLQALRQCMEMGS